jgi:hypothetical protein
MLFCFFLLSGDNKEDAAEDTRKTVIHRSLRAAAREALSFIAVQYRVTVPVHEVHRARGVGSAFSTDVSIRSPSSNDFNGLIVYF